MFPKVYQIARSLTSEQVAEVQRVLSITPLLCVFAACEDSPYASQFCSVVRTDAVEITEGPVGIVGEFTVPLTYQTEEGTQEICLSSLISTN